MLIFTSRAVCKEAAILHQPISPVAYNADLLEVFIWLELIILRHVLYLWTFPPSYTIIPVLPLSIFTYQMFQSGVSEHSRSSQSLAVPTECSIKCMLMLCRVAQLSWNFGLCYLQSEHFSAFSCKGVSHYSLTPLRLSAPRPSFHLKM